MDNRIMLGEDPNLPMIERMRLRGIDVSWYDRSKSTHSGVRKPGLPSLFEDSCGRLSIYLYKKEGQLWTISSDYQSFTPYHKIVGDLNPITTDKLICAACSAEFASTEFTKALDHNPSHPNKQWRIIDHATQNEQSKSST